jgi:hypothetical protein
MRSSANRLQRNFRRNRRGTKSNYDRTQFATWNGVALPPTADTIASLAQGGTAARRHPAWPLEDHDIRRRPAPHRNDGNDGARRPDQSRRVTGVCRAAAGARTLARRCRDHGQPVQPQKRRHPPGHRSGQRQPAFPAALQSRLQTPLPRSRPCSELPPSEPSTPCGPPSEASSTASRRANAQTTSPPQVTMQHDQKRF